MKNLSIKDYFFVGIQAVLFVFYIWSPKPIPFQLNDNVKAIFLVMAFWGLLKVIIAILQQNKHLSPFPTPKNGTVLIQSGVYKHVRHPIYSGIIISAIGYGCYSSDFVRLVVALLLWVLFYFKSNYEELLLMNRFPEYSDYMSKTNKFFSFFKRG
jgi:protein-S-isoprenylcysteine O-methyltransferase Ste14